MNSPPRRLPSAGPGEGVRRGARFGSPLFVFTGGDPLKRPDLFDLIRYSVKLGLRTNVTPSSTPLLTTDAIDRFKESGVARMAISVDGADAETHDAFRQVPGSFDRCMMALRHAQEIGLETQFQSTVTRRNMHQMERIAEIVGEVGSKMWSLFFLIVTGRALAGDDLNAEEYEQVSLRCTTSPAREVRHQDHRGDALPPLHHPAAEGRAHGRRRRGNRRQRQRQAHGVPHRRRQRRPRFRVRVPSRRSLPERISGALGGQCPARFPGGCLPQLAVVPGAAGPRPQRGEVRRVRVCPRLRRLAVAGRFALTGDYLAEDPRCVYIPKNYEVATTA